ncbi:uncharacterized protein LOC144880707 [Branchiostoma floridae x Branchiostoma japonicum]
MSGSTITETDRRHFAFMKTLISISDELSPGETANLKLFCSHLIPSAKLQKMKRAVDVFIALKQIGKLDQDNLEFIEEILNLVGRADIIGNDLHAYQPPDREIPENPDVHPGTSSENGDEESVFVTVNGHNRMIQETVNRHRASIAHVCRCNRSQVKFRGYKKGKSILVHFSVPRQTMALLRLTAEQSDPRLAFMGVKSIQIGKEEPIAVSRRDLIYDMQDHFAPKNSLPMDDMCIGCSTFLGQQRSPCNRSFLAALNLFSETLPLHMQVAETLEYQGLSYSLVQALAKRDAIRDHTVRRSIQSLKGKEIEFNTFMTLRSRLKLAESRVKELEETVVVLKREIQRALKEKELAEKVASRKIGYTGEKPPEGWASLGGRGKVATEDKLVGTDGRVVLKYDTEVTTLEAREDDHKKARITFGGKGSEPGKFVFPRGVVMTPKNEICVADGDNRRVQILTNRGVHLHQFSIVLPETGGGTMRPEDITVDKNGNLWLVGSHGSDDYVVNYTTDGRPIFKFSLPYTGRLRGIAVNDRSNQVIVTERDGINAALKVFKPDGTLVNEFGRDLGMTYPRYVAIAHDGNILVSDWDTHHIYVFDETGNFKFKFGGRGSEDGQLTEPHGVCTDSFGNIIVADRGNNRVELFTKHGEFIRHTATDLASPNGVATGQGNELVVTCWDNTVTIFPEVLG